MTDTSLRLLPYLQTKKIPARANNMTSKHKGEKINNKISPSRLKYEACRCLASKKW